MVSAKEIIARVIRNTGYKLPSMYHDDLLEWIPEGINFLSVTPSMLTLSTGDCNTPNALEVVNHSAVLPRGFVTIMAVEDEYGHIIPEGGDITDLKSTTKNATVNPLTARQTTFNANPLSHQTSDGTPTTAPGSGIPWDGEDIVPLDTSSGRGRYYKLQGNAIQTSFESGYIKIHYLALPVCKDGYPLIPDNEATKTALYWYVIMMLIGAGYKHPVFKYGEALEMWEKYAHQSMTEITYPSLDTMARIQRSTVRLIPPHHYYEDYFTNSEQGERIYK
jgi:hypothetical protein